MSNLLDNIQLGSSTKKEAGPQGSNLLDRISLGDKILNKFNPAAAAARQEAEQTQLAAMRITAEEQRQVQIAKAREEIVRITVGESSTRVAQIPHIMGWQDLLDQRSIADPNAAEKMAKSYQARLRRHNATIGAMQERQEASNAQAASRRQILASAPVRVSTVDFVPENLKSHRGNENMGTKALRGALQGLSGLATLTNKAVLGTLVGDPRSALNDVRVTEAGLDVSIPFAAVSSRQFAPEQYGAQVAVVMNPPGWYDKIYGLTRTILGKERADRMVPFGEVVVVGLQGGQQQELARVPTWKPAGAVRDIGDALRQSRFDLSEIPEPKPVPTLGDLLMQAADRYTK